MRIDFLSLLAAIALLLPPIPFSARFQKTLLSFRRNSMANALAMTRVWQNWIDFARAALGVFLLTQFAFKSRAMQPDSDAEKTALAWLGAILLLALLLQTVRWIRTVQVVAPIFYLSGMTVMLSGWPEFRGLAMFVEPGWHGVFAVIVGWLFAVVGKNLSYQPPSMAVALGAAGYVLGLSLPLILNCALILVPQFLSLLFKKRLIFAASIPSKAEG